MSTWGDVVVMSQGAPTGTAAQWAMSYYSPEPASAGSPWHTVMYGDVLASGVDWDPANDGPNPPGTTIDTAYGWATLGYDGNYYTVNQPGPFVTGTTQLRLDVTLYEMGLNADGQNVWSTVIPEPLTMVGVALSIVGLGGYIRKRRMA